jgi:uncharacterized delta-60 repeat protein
MAKSSSRPVAIGTGTLRISIATLAIACGLPLAAPAEVIGELDPSFGSGGYVQFDYEGSNSAIRALAIDPVSGKIVAGGYVTGTDKDAVFMRLNANGSVDTSFGANGYRIINIDHLDTTVSLAVRPDGRTVGIVSIAANGTLQVAQLTSSGALDTDFAGDGVAEVAVGGQAGGKALALQPADGKIVIGAFGYGGVEFRVARLTASGELDTTFNSGGSVPGVADASVTANDDVLNDVAVDPTTGKIVAVGTVNSTGFGSNTDFGIARFNTDGTLDTTFSGDGTAQVDFDGKPNEAYAVVIQSDGKIVVAGTAIRPDSTSRGDFAVARLNSNGSLDTTFDGDGKMRVPFSGLAIAYDVLVQSDGKIVLGGTQQETTVRNFAIARLNADGSLDTSFVGMNHYDYPATQYVSFGGYPPDRDDQAYALLQQADGDYVLGGSTSYNDVDFALARFHGETPINYINGTAGDDELDGTSGNDYFNGKAGADRMRGFAGDDTYVVDNAGDTVIESAGEGTDTIRSSLTYTLPNHVENLLLTGTGAINGTGNGLANTLTGNSGNNVLNGKAGADTMAGKAGNDTYYVERASDKVTEGVDQGTDTIRSTVSYTLPSNVENLILTGTSAINGTGNTLANAITGNSGNNVLNGGAGSDTLKGGAGQDGFLFNKALGSTNIDKITDFVPADDTIRLENAIFTALTTTGTLASTAFKVGTAATTTAHRIIYDPATGAVFYDKDGTGPAVKVRFATLTTKPTLTRSDFVVQ